MKLDRNECKGKGGEWVGNNCIFYSNAIKEIYDKRELKDMSNEDIIKFEFGRKRQYRDESNKLRISKGSTVSMDYVISKDNGNIYRIYLPEEMKQKETKR